MTLAEKIKNLNWVNSINKLKDILKELAGQGGGGDSRPYKVYTALLSQSGTDAPVATVLENTLGETIGFTYKGVGSYDIISTTLTNLDLVYATIQNTGDTNFEIFYNDINDLQIQTFYEGSLANDLLYYTPIEIRVYN
jgi:hypothetical protein